MPGTEVLYLSYDGMTDALGQSQVIPYLAGLSKAGYHFHLVSFEKESNFIREKDHISALLKSNNIEWHPLRYTKNPPVASTLLDLNKMKKLGAALVKKHQIKLVHCRSYISGLAGLYLQQKTGVKFLFDMRGFWADERVDGGLWDRANPVYNAIYNYFKKQEKKMLANADAVISLTENAKSEINSWNFRQPSQLPIAVIPCCADLQLFHPAKVTKDQKVEFRNKLYIEHNSIVISYLGAIGTWYLLDEMLDFFKCFLAKYPDSIFLFITHEPGEYIETIARKKNIPLTSLRFFSAKRNKVPLALSISNASLFFIKPSWSKKASSPTKQGEIMGMGIPLLCNKGIGDTDIVVEKYHSGMLVDLSPQGYEDAVDAFKNLEKLHVEDILYGANDFYSLESGVSKYIKVYRDLLS